MIFSLLISHILNNTIILILAEDLPMFPIVDKLLIAVKERVDIAREIDKLELKCRRDNSQKGWLHKAIEDMDLVLEEDEE